MWHPVKDSRPSQKKDEERALKEQVEKKDMQIDFLIREKDRLEGMIIDLQKQILENYDNTLDRVLLSESLKYDIKIIPQNQNHENNI